MNNQRNLADLTPIVSVSALRKSGRVLKAISLLYLPFHGFRPNDLFEFYGPIAFVSSAIYQADELNEHDGGIGTASLETVRAYLDRSGFLDDSISEYLKDGEKYLEYERSFRQKKRPLDIREVVTVMRWRSADFRILHCLLHRLMGKHYASATFQTYEAFEMLMEVNDDISSYAEDSKADTFNFLRALSLLPSTDANEAAREFRQDTIRRIHQSKEALPPAYSRVFSGILKTYSDIVPEPVIPTFN